MAKFVTGIGSRETPIPICNLMTVVGEKLKSEGWTLRSGHASGADRAFELGFKEQSEIYLPWNNFGVKPYKDDKGMPILGTSICDQNQWKKNYEELTKLKITKKVDSLDTPVVLLHGRNYSQVLGLPKDKPSGMVIFYAIEIDGKVQGGTRIAVELAIVKQIPVINLWKEENRLKVEKWVS